jgi:hypothetical protein
MVAVWRSNEAALGAASTSNNIKCMCINKASSLELEDFHHFILWEVKMVLLKHTSGIQVLWSRNLNWAL